MGRDTKNFRQSNKSGRADNATKNYAQINRSGSWNRIMGIFKKGDKNYG